VPLRRYLEVMRFATSVAGGRQGGGPHQHTVSPAREERRNGCLTPQPCGEESMMLSTEQALPCRP
jgi:hypothetical protein